jgi:hypothetical protein
MYEYLIESTEVVFHKNICTKEFSRLGQFNTLKNNCHSPISRIEFLAHEYIPSLKGEGKTGLLR